MKIPFIQTEDNQYLKRIVFEIIESVYVYLYTYILLIHFYHHLLIVFTDHIASKYEKVDFNWGDVCYFNVSVRLLF